MILTAIAALFGAFMGLSMGVRTWAAITAMAVMGFVHALAVLAAVGWLTNGGDPQLTSLALRVAGAEPADLWASVAAAGISALLAGMLAPRAAPRSKAKAKAAFDRAQLVGPAGQRIDELLNR